MKFYVFTIEQLHNDSGDLVEYATKSDTQNSRKSADSLFLQKAKAINDDLSEKGHTYAKVFTTDSTGVIVDHREIGQYVDQNV